MTPTSAPLSRYDAHSVRIEKPGFIPFEVRTNSIPDNRWWFADFAGRQRLEIPGLYTDRSPCEISGEPNTPVIHGGRDLSTAAPLCHQGTVTPRPNPPPSMVVPIRRWDAVTAGSENCHAVTRTGWNSRPPRA